MASEYVEWCASQAEPWCKEVSNAKRHADSLKAVADEILYRYDGIGAVRYDSEGGRPTREHGDDEVFALIEKRRKAVEDFAKSEATWVEMAHSLSNCCEMLDGRYAQLIRLRYCNGSEWDEVARVMHYDPAYVRGELKTKALAALYFVMPSRYRDPMHRAV